MAFQDGLHPRVQRIRSSDSSRSCGRGQSSTRRGASRNVMGFVPIRFRISHRPRCKSLRGYFVQGRLRGNKDTSGYEDARYLLGPRSLDSRFEDPTATWHIQPPPSPPSLFAAPFLLYVDFYLFASPLVGRRPLSSTIAQVLPLPLPLPHQHVSSRLVSRLQLHPHTSYPIHQSLYHISPKHLQDSTCPRLSSCRYRRVVVVCS